MARQKKVEEAAGYSFADAQAVAVDALPTLKKASEPNPLEEQVKAALDQGPRALPVPNGEYARKAENLLRRAANFNDWSVKIRYTDPGDTPLATADAHAYETEVWVYFSVTSDKTERVYQERKYNNATIREWANLGEKDKITPEIRAEFREAHGYGVTQ